MVEQILVEVLFVEVAVVALRRQEILAALVVQEREVTDLHRQ